MCLCAKVVYFYIIIVYDIHNALYHVFTVFMLLKSANFSNSETKETSYLCLKL